MSEIEDAEIMTPFDDYSVEELKEAYNRLFFLSELNDADLAELKQVLAALQEKDPLPPSRSVDELWDEFQTLYAPNSAELGIRGGIDSEEVVKAKPEPDAAADIPSKVKPSPIPQKRHRKILRFGLIAAVLVVILAAITVTAAAMGYNLWGWLPIWGEEELHFESETPRQEPYEVVLQNIPMVLDSLGIREPLYPTWLPEDLARAEVQIVEEPLFLFEKFIGNDRRLSITISPTSGSETTIYQKTNNAPIEYFSNDVVHYVFDNTNEVVSVWYTGDYTVLIAGGVSLDEMKKVIDSVYEVK